VTGEHGRKVFLNDQSLDVAEGYKILSGGAPRMTHIGVKADDFYGDAQGFIHRISLLLRKERVADGACPCRCSHCLLTSFSSVLPVLLDDLNDRMLDWGTKGKINPFKEVYDVCSILFPHPPLT
jgi:hypothetical protein